MNAYLLLFSAIVFEVVGTLLLPASDRFSKPIPTGTLLTSYALSFYFLSLVSQKLPLSIIYASWAGLGFFAVTLLSFIFYNQAINWQTIIGLILIIAGVTTVNYFKVALP